MSDKRDTRQEILLETINPSDFTPDELWELADSLSVVMPNFKFIPAYEDQHGAGVSWHEVIRLWVDNEDMVKDGTFAVILEHIYQAMRERFKKPAGKHRPKSVIVNDKRDGREILNTEMESPEAIPVEIEVNTRIRIIPPKRSRPDD
jgi:hypothetical protein